jgi:iron-sulfur cluster assembly protein
MARVRQRALEPCEMMSLTLEATHAIEGILAGPDVPEGGGLRIVLERSEYDGAGARLQVAIAAEPDDDDELIEKAGARVFIPAPLVGILADKRLDAEVDDEGGVRFTLGSATAAF